MPEILTLRMKSSVHPDAFIKHEIIEPLDLSIIAEAEVLEVEQSTLSTLLNKHIALRSEMT